MTKLRHFDGFGTARFITFTCYRRRRLLTTPATRWTIVNGLHHLRTERGIRILAWVIMPEHVHFVLLPPDSEELGRELGRFKSWTARQIIDAGEVRTAIAKRNTGHAAVWQRRCYDHNCRTVETVKEKIAYCHANPVKRRLVSSPELWLWSSYNWYQGEGRVVLEIDGIES